MKNEPKEIVLPKDIDEQLGNIILYSVILGFGGITDETTRGKFSESLKKLLEADDVRIIFKLLDTPDGWEPKRHDFKLPGDYFDITYTKRKDSYMWISWLHTLPQAYVPDKFANFNEIIVTAKDDIRVSYMMSFLLGCGKNLLFCGPTGTGKTVCVLDRLKAQFSNERRGAENQIRTKTSA